MILNKEFIIHYVFSNGSSTQSIQAVTEDYEEPTEVARYNLQGNQISEDEKGIQIIVYSDFTTKVIINK